MPPQLIDSQGKPVALGKCIGRGGEGSVYEVAGRSEAVAKLYHEPMPGRRAAKIRAMCRMADSQLSSIAAWPLELLLSPKQEPRGLIIPNLTGCRELHDLYGPKSRKANFPKADFKFLVRTAADLARVFASMHAIDVIIGDVNPGGVFVSPDAAHATVRLIDCDSFQIRDGAHFYGCEVGVPMFTAPELLQLSTFRGVRRTPNHDNFGLAILIFHLLFMGCHPYAGRYAGGEMPIEQAIKEHRFAYGGERHRFGMQPPPHMNPVPLAPNDIAHLFEKAFSASAANGALRPAASEWHHALKGLEAQLKACNINHAHAYLNTLPACPWCEVEARTGASLFNFVWPHDSSAPGDIEAIWLAIRGATIPPLPLLTSSGSVGRLQPSKDALTAIELRRALIKAEAEFLIARKKLDQAEAALRDLESHIDALKDNSYKTIYFLGFGVGGILTFYYTIMSQYSVSSVISLTTLIILISLARTKRNRERKLKQVLPQLKPKQKDVDDTQYVFRLSERGLRFSRQRFGQARGNIDTGYKSAEDKIFQIKAYYKRLEVDRALAIEKIEQTKKDTEALYKNYKSLDEGKRKQLQILDARRRADQLESFLDSFYIEKAKIERLSANLKATLASYNIETAADIEEAKIRAVPGFGPVLTGRLVAWRKSREQAFIFDASKPVDQTKVHAIDARIAAERQKVGQLLAAGAHTIRNLARGIEKRLEDLKRENEQVIKILAQAEFDKKALESSA